MSLKVLELEAVGMKQSETREIEKQIQSRRWEKEFGQKYTAAPVSELRELGEGVRVRQP